VTCGVLLARPSAAITTLVSEWYLYDDEGKHRGPLTTQALLDAIRAGEVAEDAWVAPEKFFEPPGASGWRRATDIPELAEKIRALGVKSPLNVALVDGAFRTTRLGTPAFDATAMIVVNDSDPHAAGGQARNGS